MFPSDERISAIKNLKDPKNKKDLQKFLGIINYVRNFIPNLADITAPLRDLLKKNILFRWEKIHTDTVEKIKNILTSPVVLRSFDSNKSILIQTDASRYGLGRSLLQEVTSSVCFKKSLTH